MGSEGSWQTTVKSRGPGGAREATLALRLRWLFPKHRVTPLVEPRLVLGRGDDCNVKLEGRETSRHHGEIRREGPILVLQDLGSRNGVYLNGSRCKEAPLSIGDLIRVGDWLGIVEPNGEEPGDAGVSEIVPGLLAGPRMRAALEPARRAASSDLPIIVEGETGTGKECVARAIHQWSGRSGAFTAVNCAALPETLAEAELFGHRKGAFTGASSDAQGYFRAAHGGTLLLDEVVDLPLAVQAKLLRVVETNTVVPLGDTRPTRVDVRIIAAAQSPLRDAVADRRFRADLLARLEGVAVDLPPLRARREDVPPLFLHLLARHSGGHPPRVDPAAIERLCLHDWPYNVRELVQAVRRVLALHGTARVLTEAHLPETLTRPAPPGVAREPNWEAPTSRKARHGAALLRRLAEVLKRNGGNLTRAARAVGISRQRAYRLLQKDTSIDLEALRFPAPPDEDLP